MSTAGGDPLPGAVRDRAAALFGNGPRRPQEPDPAPRDPPESGPAPGEADRAADDGARRPLPPPLTPSPSPSFPLSLRGRLLPALRDRLPPWALPRFGLRPRAVAALGAVLVTAALLAVQHFWLGRPRAVSAPVTVGAAHDASAGRPAGPPDTGPAPAPGPPPAAPSAGPGGGRVVVDLAGAVRHPGVLRLPAGSRVEDALRAAGGPEEGTDLTGLNRARVLTDGEQVVVGAPQGAVPAPPAGSGAPGVPGAPGSQPLSLSTATADQLDTLPGVGPVLAQHILDYRAQNGGFRSVDELREVGGIGDRRFADLEKLVRP
ncbi:ComEA family DNA-binding protein [Streptomyces sp. NPDC047002]|uniref:ComEA family DNA-binding protein n=1 Tax=Streptomyces sp. NPDC047002 TaxID=3155475 RepID=UPI0034531D9B